MPRQEPGEPYFRITSEEASEMHGNEDVVFIDVRRPDEYAEGHIKDALFMPVDPSEGFMQRVDELPEGKKLLFICAVGVRSGLACEMAAAMGVDQGRLYNIEDGTPTWVEKGYPTSFGADL
jgi:rhodanese-related sulfurtransferase